MGINITKDYYRILHIPSTATHNEIKSAFRKLALRYHPDKNHGSEVAESKFKDINEAYTVLTDAQVRRKYDLHRRLSAFTSVSTTSSYAFAKIPQTTYQSPTTRTNPRDRSQWSSPPKPENRHARFRERKSTAAPLYQYRRQGEGRASAPSPESVSTTQEEEQEESARGKRSETPSPDPHRMRNTRPHWAHPRQVPTPKTSTPRPAEPYSTPVSDLYALPSRTACSWSSERVRTPAQHDPPVELTSQPNRLATYHFQPSFHDHIPVHAQPIPVPSPYMRSVMYSMAGNRPLQSATKWPATGPLI